MRTIVSISVAGVDENMSTQSSVWIVALCNDGSTWYITERELSANDYLGWKRLPEIPQDFKD